MKAPYIRVGTHYYKIVEKPFATGSTSKFLTSWSKDNIILDHGIDYLKKIPKYDGFCCIPSHTNFQQEIGTFYNQYHKLEHTPKEGSIVYTMKFLKHIFGKQIEIALDYLKLIYENPTQMLPILCLVSQERHTGKTTFLKWLKAIYSFNMAYLDSQTIGSRFNSDWMGKVIVGVEEFFVQNDTLVEILKNIASANRYNSEAKGKDRVEVDMFLKIVLCSNKETNFLKIDNDEIRFWVVKVPSIKSHDANLLDKLTVEISAFLHFLQNRSMHTPNPLSRMWFSPAQLVTPALRKMKMASKNRLELDLATALYTAMEDLGIDEIKLTPLDAIQIIGKNSSYLLEIRRILKNNWNLKPQINLYSYKRLCINNMGYHFKSGAKGRYYIISKKFLDTNFDDLMN